MTTPSASINLDRRWRPQWPLLVALCLSSAMSIVMVVFRIAYTENVTYSFLVWNLFLAWMPLWNALALWQLSRYGLRTIPLLALFFVCWLLFFPNSPYIVTDFLHLTPRQNVPLWFDLMLIFSFAWNGLILGFTSLWIVQDVVQTLFGRMASWLVVAFALSSSGFAIYLGRFLNWNSWDVVTAPSALLTDIYGLLANPFAHPRTLAVTILFSSFLTVAYLTFALLTRTRWAAEGDRVKG
jgi:uncharacterized membrane protein